MDILLFEVVLNKYPTLGRDKDHDHIDCTGFTRDTRRLDLAYDFVTSTTEILL